MSGVPVTALYAGVMGLVSVLLANQVLYARLRADRLPGWKPDAMLRVQANFVENVPLALVLMLVLEMQQVSGVVIHTFGIALVILRVLHAWGLGTFEGANYPRLIGAQGTFLLISIMSVAAVYGFSW